MSAVRNNNRGAVRNTRASPYARPAAQKSSWSISGFLSYLNPLRSFSPTREDQEDQAQGGRAGSAPASANSSPNTSQQNLPASGHKVRFADLPKFSLPQQKFDDRSASAPPGPQQAQQQQIPLIQPHSQSNSPYFPRRSVFVPAPPPQPPSAPNGIIYDMSRLPTPILPEDQASETSGSPSNRDTVVQYLQEAKGRKLNTIEIAGIVSLLKEDALEDGNSEPFRFQSASPAPSSTPPSNSATPQPTKSGRLLAKNPNGTYKWQGAGSSRPKHRYHSPGFGQPRASSSRIRLSPPKTLTTDSKRRRVGLEAESSLAQPVSVAATPSSSHQTSLSTTTNGNHASISNGTSSAWNRTSAVPKINTTSSLPRIHTSLSPHKATVPARPSPLRQAWSSEEPPSQTQAETTKQPTRAAAFMQELVREFPAPKKSDVANPYQQMMPARAKKTTIPRKTRSAAAKEREEKEKEQKERESEKEKEKEKEKEGQKRRAPRLSGQAIIEATVPKGSKRARPPPDLSKSQSKDPVTSPSSPRTRSQRLKSPPPQLTEQSNPFIEVEEIADEEGPAIKKQKKEKDPSPRGIAQDPVIDELDDDVDMAPKETSTPPAYIQPSEVIEPAEPTTRISSTKATSPPSTTGAFGLMNGGPALRPAFGLKSTAPKEPSKLRYSYQAESDGESSVSSTSGAKSSEPATTLTSATSGETVPSGIGSPLVEKTPSFDVPSSLSAAPASTAPPETASLSGSSSAPCTGSSTPSLFGPSPAAAKSGSSTTPSFGSAKPLSGSSSSTPASGSSAAANPAPTPLGPAINLVPGRRYPKEAAVTMDIDSLPVYSFTSSRSPDVVPAHFKARGETLAKAESALPTFDFTKYTKTAIVESSYKLSSGFNWAAAGMKPPAPAGWTCSVCMVSNIAGASKCVACEEPAPASVPKPASPGGFNWAAAGMKPPAAAGWTCSVCMVNNTTGATKCVACEEPAPPGPPKPKPVSGGFNWDAAGMKKPENTGNWTCKHCMCSSPGDADQCIVCEEPRS